MAILFKNWNREYCINSRFGVWPPFFTNFHWKIKAGRTFLIRKKSLYFYVVEELLITWQSCFFDIIIDNGNTISKIIIFSEIFFSFIYHLVSSYTTKLFIQYKFTTDYFFVKSVKGKLTMLPQCIVIIAVSKTQFIVLKYPSS